MKRLFILFTGFIILSSSLYIVVNRLGNPTNLVEPKKEDSQVRGIFTGNTSPLSSAVSLKQNNLEEKTQTQAVQQPTAQPETQVEPKEFKATNSKSFYLVSTSTDLSSIEAQIFFKDGTVASLDKVFQSDGNFGDTQNAIKVSQIYDYEKQVDKIILAKGYSDIDVVFREDQGEVVGSVGILDEAFEYESSYKNRLFSALGFNYVTREEWGAPSYSLWYPDFSKINRVVVHHTATSVDSANPANTVRAVYNEHKIRCSNNSGYYPGNCGINETWSDIGYNYLIDQYGTVYEGRAGGNTVIGAHAIPNSGAIGIALLGNYTSVAPSSPMIQTLTRLTAALSALNDFTVTWQQSLFGHRDYLNTECPGSQVYSRLPQIAVDVEAYKAANYREIIAQRAFADEFVTNTPDILVDGDYKFIVLTDNLDELMKQKLATRSWSGKHGGGSYRNDAIVYINPNMAITFIAELYLAIPQVQFYVNDGTSNGSPEAPTSN